MDSFPEPWTKVRIPGNPQTVGQCAYGARLYVLLEVSQYLEAIRLYSLTLIGSTTGIEQVLCCDFRLLACGGFYYYNIAA